MPFHYNFLHNRWLTISNNLLCSFSNYFLLPRQPAFRRLQYRPQFIQVMERLFFFFPHLLHDPCYFPEIFFIAAVDADDVVVYNKRFYILHVGTIAQESSRIVHGFGGFLEIFLLLRQPFRKPELSIP